MYGISDFHLECTELQFLSHSKRRFWVCKLSSFFMMSASLTASRAAWSSKRGMLSCLRGASRVLAITNATSILPSGNTKRAQQTAPNPFSEASPKTWSSTFGSRGASLHRHLGNSNTFKDDKEASQLSQTIRPSSCKGSSQPILLHHRV